MRSIVAALLLAVSIASATSAFADVAPPVSPPVPQSSTEVPYPPNAKGDAVVLLELVVEKDGTVASAVVVEGAEPFAEPARAAVLSWRFAPARRDDAPIAVRIRARVEFHEPRPPDAPSAALEPAAPVASTPAPPETPLEVIVRGAGRAAGQTTLSAGDVREMPGAFGDPFRAIEALPGVTPLVSGLPYFYIRGAPPNDNGFYVDGIRVPLLFHLGIGQGVIHPGLLDHVDFFPSAAPARYGGVAGATIAGQTREPATQRRGEASLRLVDAGGLVETPFADGRGSALVAGRYGYPGPILGAITSGLTLDYWDYQARATWRLAARDTVGLFAFGSHDRLATPSPSADPTAPPIEQFVSDFHRLDLRYDHELADGHLRLALTGGTDRQGVAPTYVSSRSAAARLEIDLGLSPTLRARGGAGARLDAWGFHQNAIGPGDATPVPSTADPPPTNVTAGAHADVVWRPTSRFELVVGGRFEVFASSRAGEAAGAPRERITIPAADPRLSARVMVTPAVAWLSAAGLSHQYPTLRAAEIPTALVAVPGFPRGDRQLQTAAQVSQGVELTLPADLVLTATGFLSLWWGLVDLPSAACPLTGQPPVFQCPGDQPIRGHAYGVELLLRRALSKRLGGWLSYTLSRSVRQAHFVTAAGDDVVATVASDYDRTHVLNAIVAYDLGRRWRAGARSVFYTGTPYSQGEGGLSVPPYNAYRNPSFFRLDVRLEKRWPLGENGKSGSIALVIEVQNVTLSTETVSFGQDCMSDPGGATQCVPNRSKIGPITIPSVGVEAYF